MVLVLLFDLKFLTEFASRAVGTSNRRALAFRFRTDPLHVGPSGRCEHRLDSAGSGAGIYSINALLGLGVVKQKLERTMAAAGDAREDGPQGAWVGAEGLHQVDGIIVGGSFHAAGIACLQNSFCCNDNGASADEISKQQAEGQAPGPV